MNRNFLDEFGEIAEAYIDEAAGTVVAEKKRSPWGAIAAVLALVLAVGSAWLLLRGRLHREKAPVTDPTASQFVEASKPEPIPNTYSAGEKVCFRCPNISYELVDANGAVSRYDSPERIFFEGDIQVEDWGLYGETPAYDLFYVPYSDSYQFLPKTDGFSISAICGRSVSEVSGNGLRSLKWTLNSWTLEAEASTVEFRIGQGTEEEFDVFRYNVIFEGIAASDLNVSWTEGEIRVIGGLGEVTVKIFDCETCLFCEPFRFSQTGEAFSLRTDRLEEDVCVLVQDGGETEFALTWTDPSEPSTPEEPVDQARNLMDLDPALDAVIASDADEDVKNACRWVQNRIPSAKNEMTGLFAGKNLIIITAQNFSAEVIDPERTPILYRLATQGIRFTDYYQPDWGGAASSGECAILTGLVPAHGVQSILDAAEMNTYLTVGNQLQRQGYLSLAWCDDHSYDYLHRDETHVNLGYDRLIGIGSGLEELVTRQWPYSDRETVLAASQIVDWQPFNVYFMLCSTQGTYNRQGNSIVEQHWDEVADLPYSDTVKGYLAANMEVEGALRELVDGLETLGIADDTVIVLTAAQRPYTLEKSEDWNTDEDYLAELYGYEADDVFKRDHSALIVWSGCLEGKNYKVTTPTSSLDIVPTLSNLFGLEYDSRLLMGRDVFSDREPLVLWPDGSWKTDQASYNAATGLCVGADGEPVTDEYADAHHEEAANRIKFSDTALGTDLLARLLPRRIVLKNDRLLCTPGPDPCAVVRDSIERELEKDFTVSLEVEEVRLDEGEKQKLLAWDLTAGVFRDGAGADLQALLERDTDNVAVVYARYRVEYDHTKTSYRDGDVYAYYCLVRDGNGNWDIYTATSTEWTAQPEPSEEADPG